MFLKTVLRRTAFLPKKSVIPGQYLPCNNLIPVYLEAISLTDFKF
jgi:hypothetical protein